MTAQSRHRRDGEDLGNPEKAKAARLEAARKTSMSKRLEQLHRLGMQMDEIKGIASR